MNNLPVLLTASISTHGMKGACFSDKEREKQYLTTLSFYLSQLPDQKFVFAENSGWNLESFKEKLFASDKALNRDNVEFISVDYSLCDISRGKGYNEMILISEAVRLSDCIRESAQFMKATGRYPIYNLGYFIKTASGALSKGAALYCDIKDHKIYDWLKLGWTGHAFDCRLFACSVHFFNRHFAPTTQECNDYNGNLLEFVLFRAVKRSEDKMSLRFKREPHFGGLAGHQIDAVSFSQSHDDLKSKFKRTLGNFIRISVPWLKF